MPHYHSLGKFPSKRHVQFTKPEGGLYSEQLVSTEGFSDLYSLTYHVYPPTMVTQIDNAWDASPRVALAKNTQHRSFKGFNVEPEDDFLKSRKYMLVNRDCYVSLAAPRKSMTDYFYKNSSATEILFIHKGSGVLKTMYGNLRFSYGDHLVIPKGVHYQIHFDDADNRLFIVESFGFVKFPRRYINRAGQLLEHSPFCERDIRKPSELETFDQKGDFKMLIKKDDLIYPYHFATHPFDVIGWDGYHYPYALSVHDFEPITGRVHQPPTVHQTFDCRNFVMCAFVPRLYDYHPLAIPAPYNHSNVDSDEVLYYVDGDFMSRNNIEKGQITLHPIGIVHGPHPGAVERSIGKTATEELAIMVDTFNPLMLTEEAMGIEDPDYYKSWIH